MTVLETIESNTKLISVTYLSEVSGIPRKTLYKTITGGSLPVYRVGGAIWIEPKTAGKWFRDHYTGR